MDLRFIELMQSAKVIVEDLAMVKAGEEALIVTDTRISEYYGTEELFTALVAAISAVGAEPVIICCSPRKSSADELPAIVGAAMKNAKVIFTILTHGTLQTLANREAIGNGARIMALPCGDRMGKLNDMIYRLMPKTKAEVDELAALTRKVGERFAKGQNVRLTTEKGTDITMKIFEHADRINTHINTGFLDEPGMLSFAPTGQNAIGVIPGTANGKVVVDASIHPLREPLKEPIYMTFENGLLIDIQGGEEAQRYKELLASKNDPRVYNLVEIGTGNNPKAMIMAESLEDERYYGGGHIGIGANAPFGGDIRCGWHSDAIIYNVTIEIDGELIMKNGKYLI